MSLLGALTQEEFCIQSLEINFSHQVCPLPFGWQTSSQAAHRDWPDPHARLCLNNSQVKVLKKLLLGTGAMGVC